MSFYHDIGGTPAVVSIVVGAIIAIAVTRFYANKSKITKALGWTPAGITKIVTRPVTDVAQGLALTWDGVPLSLPYTVKLRVANVGTREVVGSVPNPDRSDYIEPLKVAFDASTCYEAVVTAVEQAHIDVRTRLISDPTRGFIMEMPTLNMSSWVELEMIADGPAEYPQLSCTLIGETAQITLVTGRQRSRFRTTSFIACGLGAVIFLIGFGLLGLYSFNYNGPGYGAPVLITIGIAIALIGGGAGVTAWLLDRSDLTAMKRETRRQID